MTTELHGATVLVIGGAKNLGKAIAESLDSLGARVVIGARDVTAADEVAATLGQARGIAIDITDEATIASAARELGGVDHVISTAAAHHNVRVAELDHAKTVTAFEAKVIGPILVAKHFAPIMPRAGSITLFAGVAAWQPAAGYALMGITNGALAFAVTHLAKELAPLRVNAISPGIIDSGMWDSMDDPGRQAFFADVARELPAGRVGAPADIVDAVRWLLDAEFITGETIHIEGGARSS
ncbi:SDR family oxidoreductase [Gordonia bronchialis]|uniref:SDR family oxidoreductase n=1 Tax=Gordonia bronchialis TaxID=2054 RepID=UPI002270D290|nr:SDR family oxidoreductase [Gordonia bronchialis]